MKKITGRSAFLSILRSEGVTHLFGNPGTTELPIMHALKDYPEIKYIFRTSRIYSCSYGRWILKSNWKIICV